MKRLTLLLLTACGPAPASGPGAAPVAIQPSLEADRDAAAPLDAGKPEVQRCLASARCGDGCAERCRAHDHEACHDVATAHHGADDETCALVVWEAACQVGHNKSCGALGEQLLDREGERARELLERACNGSVATSCLELANHEVKLPGRRGQALARYERGCSLGLGRACTQAGLLHREGAGVPADADRAMMMLERACELGDGLGCYEGAQVMLQGSAARRRRAIELLEQTCLHGKDTGGVACWQIAKQSLSGVTLNRTDAFRRACDKGHLEGCFAASEALYRSGRWREAIESASRLIDKQPQRWQPWYFRGMSKLNLGRPGEAIGDLEMLCPRRSDWVHCELWLWASRKRAGGKQAAKADQALSDRRKTLDAKMWPSPVMDHMLGRITATEMFARAKDGNRKVEREQLCEAHFYRGMRLLVDGKVAPALTEFEKTVSFNITSFIEHERARAEIARLQKQP